MADQIINLATFEFDTDRLQSSLNTLQDRMFALKKENELYTKQMKEAQATTKLLTAEQEKLKESGKELTQEYKDNEATLEQLNEAEKQLYKNQQNTITSQSRVRTEIAATNKELKSYMTSEAQYQTLTDAGNVALQTQVTNINQARASNTELLRVRNQLNPAIASEAKLITDLNAKMDANNKFIKNNASEYEKTKINIGNYTESVKQALQETGLIGAATNALPAPLKTVAIGFQQVGDTLKGVQDAYSSYREAQEQVKEAQEQYATLTNIANEATNAATIATETATAIGFQYGLGTATQTELEVANTAATIANTTATEAQATATAAGTVVTNASSNSLKLFRLALISTGIGAIVVLLGSLVSYLTTTQSGIDALTSVTRPLQAIFSGLGNILNVIGKALVDTFTNPKQALKDLGDFLINNIINRFKAFGVILDGIINMDFKKIADGALQAGTGVEGLTGKIANAGKETAKFLSDAAAKGAEIDRLTKEMAKSQLEYNAAQVAFNDAVDKQLLISKDTSKSFAERGAAAKEIIRLSEENGKKEEAILQLELRRLKVQQELKGLKNLTNADRQEEIDLLEKIDAAEDRGLNAQLEQSRVLAGLRKEEQAAELERVKKLQDAKLSALKTELDFYIESQGEKKKSMADELAEAEVIKNKQLAINKEEYNQKKINKREYELANLETTNEFLAKQTELVIANSQLEFELFQLNQQRKVDANLFYNDELYQQDLNRINKQAEAEAAQQTLLFEKGKINAEEYGLAIAQIDQKQTEANDAAAAQRLQAEKDKKAADQIIQDELNAERFEYDLTLQTERNERERLLAVENAKKSGADVTAINDLYAKKQMTIERTVQNNKMQLNSEALGNIATLLGESSDAGKAAAIAQTTIDTYLGAQKAYTSQLIAGDPSSFLRAGLAAGAAVVSGLINVKKIVSTKTGGGTAQEKPKYARGVIGAGTGTSDSIDARLSAGESVLTARATQMFPDIISTINQAGGGVGLNGLQGSSSLMMQESLRSNTDNNSQLIAEAVYLASLKGTSEGSSKGITDLSTNRQIIENAKF